MSFLLPKLPSVIQLEVLKQLERQEIFLLSLCSEKMKRVVQCLIMKPTSLIYSFLDNGVGVLARYDNTPVQIHGVADVEFVADIPSDEMKPMKLGGNKIDCRYMKRTNAADVFHLFHYLASEETTVLESLQSHLRDLFRFDTRVQLDLSSVHHLNMSRSINNVADTNVDVEELNTEQLENFLTTHPGQDSLSITAKLTGPLMTSESKLFSIKGLAVQAKRDPLVLFDPQQNPRLHFSEIISNFGGEYLVFIDVTYDVNDWAQLIRRWKRKEAYHNLKFVSTTPPTGVSIPFEHVMQQFDFVKWDGQRRPRIAKLYPKIIYFLDSVEHDCSEWMDIQQDGGGKWASLSLSQEAICFIVWD